MTVWDGAMEPGGAVKTTAPHSTMTVWDGAMDRVFGAKKG